MKLSVIKAIRYNEITREIEMPHKNPKSQKEKNLYEQLQNTFSETQRKLYYEYETAFLEEIAAENDRVFSVGFRYGLLLGIEIYTSED